MNQKLIRSLGFAILFFAPVIAFGTVESTLETMQARLVGQILPLVAILGFVFSGFSYLTGNPNARTHLFLACIGAVVGFGASSIMTFIRSLVQ